jgi:hypothetical protein
MNAKNFKVAVDLYVKKPKFRNLYCDFESFKLLVTNEFYFVDGESIFIFKKENGIYKLYFLLQDKIDLKKVRPLLKEIKTEVVIDYLTKNNIDSEVFKQAGFVLYKTFSRYFVLGTERTISKRKNSKVELARLDDVFEINELIQSVFNPRCDFMPTIHELEVYAKKQELYVQKKDDVLLGFALFIKEPYGYDFRLSCVNPKYQSGLVGYDFVQALPTVGKKFICWVDDDNRAAIRLNENIGFKKDGLKNFIFVKK